jgi:hypothetical protein
MINVSRELQRIAQTKALAQITGLVSIRQNRAGFFSFGQQMPDIREGDTLQPGMPVADLLDLSELEVVTKVGELDRANLKEGQDALLQLDAIPDKQFHGKIKAMSGTATSDVFSGDPSKKFDVIFSIDMRQLLTGLGMKPVDVDRIMATADSNSKKNVVNTASSFFSSLQGGVPGAPGAPGGLPGAAGGVPGMPGAGQPGMPGQPGQDNQDQGDQGGGGRAQRGAGGGGRGGAPGGGRGGDLAGGQGRGRGGDNAAGGGSGRGGDNAAGGGPGRGMANLSDEDRQKMQQLRQQAQAASEADRPKIMQQMQELMAKAGGGRGPGGRGGDGGPGEGRGGRGPGGGAGAGFMGGGNPADMMAGRGGGGGGRNGSPFTEEERTNAKLPIPPEQDSQVQALLRPGLLADVEIVVEKIPDVLHVPAQAVFTRNGKPTVFVQQKNGRFEAREVQLQKQSESLMVLTSGVQPGEILALADPTSDKSDKKKSADKKSGPSNPMGGVPGTK